MNKNYKFCALHHRGEIPSNLNFTLTFQKYDFYFAKKKKKMNGNTATISVLCSGNVDQRRQMQGRFMRINLTVYRDL